jgi:hypothetical protein
MEPMPPLSFISCLRPGDSDLAQRKKRFFSSISASQGHANATQDGTICHPACTSPRRKATTAAIKGWWVSFFTTKIRPSHPPLTRVMPNPPPICSTTAPACEKPRSPGQARTGQRATHPPPWRCALVLARQKSPLCLSLTDPSRALRCCSAEKLEQPRFPQQCVSVRLCEGQKSLL